MPTITSRLPVVSTHAPAWGATIFNFHIFLGFVVSTHAPAWGATSVQLFAVRVIQFQLTLPRGERP